jgi:ribosomal protein S12 methylthiotransferase accessory factor
MNLNDERPLWENLGLTIPLGTLWKQLRIGELKTLLALAVGDDGAWRRRAGWCIAASKAC